MILLVIVSVAISLSSSVVESLCIETYMLHDCLCSVVGGIPEESVCEAAVCVSWDVSMACNMLIYWLLEL